MLRKTLFTSLALALLLGATHVQAQTKATDTLSTQQLRMMEAYHLISPQEIEAWAVELTSDAYRGRRSGDVGYDMAADFVMRHFREWGVQPKGDNGTYENTFAQPFNDVLGNGYLKAYFPQGKDLVVKDYAARKDYFPSAISDSGSVKGEVVYVGYGITAPELKHDDYKGYNMAGKIALIESGLPYKGKSEDSLKMWNKYLRAPAKIRAAANAGAAGVLLISPYSSPSPREVAGMVVTCINKQTAADLLSGTGRTPEEWRKLCDQFKNKPVPTRHEVDMAVQTRYSGNTTTANIVGVIEGTDPVLKDEYIILGAHLDHIGMLPEIHPGAQDNASGSVITMAAAKAIAQSKVELKRSIIVVLIAAEELGVFGADHYLKTLPYPKEKILCMVNTDMLATGTGFMVHSATEWEPLVACFREASENWTHRPFKASLTPWEYKARLFTDGNRFQNEGIPTFELKSTGGKWPAPYHVPEDTMVELDPVIMADAARVMAIAAIRLANLPAITLPAVGIK